MLIAALLFFDEPDGEVLDVANAEVSYEAAPIQPKIADLPYLEIPSTPVQGASDANAIDEGSPKLVDQLDRPLGPKGNFVRSEVWHRSGRKFSYMRTDLVVKVDPDTQEQTITQSSSMVADHILVKVGSSVGLERLADFGLELGISFREHPVADNVFFAQLPSAQVQVYDEVLLALQTEDILFDAVEPDQVLILHGANTPNDPLFPGQWALHGPLQADGTEQASINATDAWRVTTGSSEVVVAIIDTGIDYNHRDIQDNLWINELEAVSNGLDDDQNGYIDDLYGWNFITNSNDTQGGAAHGMLCAGVIGAVGDNGMGSTGVAWDVTLMSLKVVDSFGEGVLSDAVSAINYAVEKGARLTNISWGFFHDSTILRDAMQAAAASEMLFIVSAGNDRLNIDEQPVYPASFDLDNVITVSGHSKSGDLWWDANYGVQSVDLSAPTQLITSPIAFHTYTEEALGTSVSAAFVTGTAALLLSANPEATIAELRSYILGSVTELDVLNGKVATGGALNAGRAVLDNVDSWFEFEDLYWVGQHSSRANQFFGVGDRVGLRASIANRGFQSASGLVLKAELTNSSSDVIFESDEFGLPSIAGGSSRSLGGDEIVFNIPEDLDALEEIEIRLVLLDPDGNPLVECDSKLVLSPLSEFRGTVKRASGANPPATTEVVFQGPVHGSVEPDSNGRFSVWLPVGDYLFSARADGYSFLDVDASDPTDISMSLGRPRIVTSVPTIHSDLNPGASESHFISIRNDGDAPLDYSFNNPGNSLIDSWEDEDFSDWNLENTDQVVEVSSESAADGDFSLRNILSIEGLGRSSIHREGSSFGWMPTHIEFYVLSSNSEAPSAKFQFGYDFFHPIFTFSATGDSAFKVNDLVTQPLLSDRWYKISFHSIDWENRLFDLSVDGRLISSGISFEEPITSGRSRVVLSSLGADIEIGWDGLRIFGQALDFVHVASSAGTLLPGEEWELEVELRGVGNIGQTMQASFLLDSNDPEHISSSHDVSVTILGDPSINLPPNAEDLTYSSLEDEDVLIELNGSDPEGTAVSVYVHSLPDNGTLYRANSSGRVSVEIGSPTYLSYVPEYVVFRPDPDENGVSYTSFEYELRDRDFESSIGTITIDVSPVNDPPRVDNVFVDLQPTDSVVSLSLLDHAQDPEGDAVTIALLTEPQFGQVSQTDSVTIEYTATGIPPSGYDQFYVVATDGLSESIPALVQIRYPGNGDSTYWGADGGSAGHDNSLDLEVSSIATDELWEIAVRTDRDKYAAIAGEFVIVTDAGQYSGPKRLACFGKLDGELRWEVELKNSRPTSPAIGNGLVFVQMQNVLAAFSMLDGKPVWDVDLEGIDNFGDYAPVHFAETGLVYAIAGTNLRAYDATTGSLVFGRQVQSDLFGWTPAAGVGRLYLYSSGQLLALDALTGEDIWSVPAGAGSKPVVPVYHDGYIALPSSQGVVVYDAADGQELWSAGGGGIERLAISEGELFMANVSAERVKGFDLDNGDVILDFFHDLHGVSNLAVSSDYLFVSGLQGTGIFHRSNGSLLELLPSSEVASFSESQVVLASYQNYKIIDLDTESLLNPEALAQEYQVDEDSSTYLQCVASRLNGTGAVSAVLTSLPDRGRLYQAKSPTEMGAEITKVPALLTDPALGLFYEPPEDEFGESFTTFAFRVIEGDRVSREVEGLIHVNQITDPLVALDDHYTIRVGGTLANFLPSENDFDPVGDGLEIIDFNLPTRGNLQLLDDGRFVYSDEGGLEESEIRFDYTIRDGLGRQSVASVRVVLTESAWSDWNTPGGSSSRTGSRPDFFDAGNLSLLWSRDLGGAARQALIDENRVYLASAIISAPLAEDRIYALDFNTGALVWEFDPTENDVASSLSEPTISGGSLFFLCDFPRYHRGAGPEVFSLDTSTGSLNWNLPYENQWLDSLAPVVENGKIWFSGGTYGGIYSFDAQSGDELAFLKLPDKSRWTPSYNGDLVYSYIEGYLRAHDPETLEIVWEHFDQPRYFHNGTERYFAIEGQLGFAIEGDGLNCDLVVYDLEKSNVAWRSNGELLGDSTPAIRNGLLYALADNGRIKVFNIAAGLPAGDYSVNDTFLAGQPIVTSNRLFAAGMTGTHVFDLHTRELIQTLPATGELSLAYGMLIVVSEAGVVDAYSQATAGTTIPKGTDPSWSTLEDAALEIDFSSLLGWTVGLNVVIETLPTSGQLYQLREHGIAAAPIVRAETMVSNSGGKILYRPESDEIGVGLGNFTFRFVQGLQSSTSYQAQIDILSVNDAPRAFNDSVSVDVGATSFEFDPRANDIDTDGDTLEIISFTQPTIGTVEITASGSLKLLLSPQESQVAQSVEVNYTIEDPFGERASASVHIAIGSSAKAEWPAYGGDLRHSGYYERSLGNEPFSLFWETEIPGELTFGSIGSERLFVSASRDGYIPGLYALDVGSGAIDWYWEIPEPESSYGFAAAAYREGRIYVPYNNRHASSSALLSLDAADGSLNWYHQHSPQGQMPLHVIVTDHSVYFEGDGFSDLIGLNIDTGHLRFRSVLPVGSFSFSSDWVAAHENGRLFSFTGNRIVEHDGYTGQWMWHTELPGDDGGGAFSRTMAIDNGRAFVVNENGDPYLEYTHDLVAVDLNRREVLWSVDGRFSGTPSIEGEFVYAIEGGTVFEFLADTGELSRAFETRTEVLNSQPLVSNDLLFIASDEETFVFDRGTASVIQTIPCGGALSLVGDKLFITRAENAVQVWHRPNSDNASPVAFAQDINGFEDSPVQVYLKGMDLDGDELVFMVRSLPEEGRLLQSDGGDYYYPILRKNTKIWHPELPLLYFPEKNVFGSAVSEFEFSVSDSEAISDPAAISISLGALDDAPIAVDDDESILDNSEPTTLKPLSNDYDVEGSSLTLVGFTQPHIGSISVGPNETLIYSPDSSQIDPATTSFTYTIEDSFGLRSLAIFTLHLNDESSYSWMTFGADASRSGHLPVSFGEGNLLPLWQVNLSQRRSAADSMNLITARDRVFFLYGDYLNQNRDEVLAFSLDDGSLEWRQSDNVSYQFRGVTAYEGALYFNENDRFLSKVDISSGLYEWTSTPSAYYWGPAFSPLVYNDQLFSFSGGSFSSPGELASYQFETGDTVFAFRNDYSSTYLPSGYQGYIYTVGGQDFLCLDPATGEVLWSVELPLKWDNRGNEEAIAIADGIAALTIDSDNSLLGDELICIDLETREIRWSTIDYENLKPSDRRSNHTGTPAVRDGRIYITDRNEVYVFDAIYGAIIQKYEAPEGTSLHGVVLANDRLFVSGYFETFVFDRWSGELLQVLPGAYPAIYKKNLVTRGETDLFYYTIPEITFDPPSGTSSSNQFPVMISTDLSGGVIRYSIDSVVSPEHGRTEVPFDLSASATVNAVVVKDGIVSSTASASYTITDTDTDQLPDWWEALNPGPIELSKLGDADRDGFSDWEEWRFGTDPRNSSDRPTNLEMSMGQDNLSIEIDWASKADRFYRVKQTDDFEDWTSVSPWTRGTGESMSHSVPIQTDVNTSAFFSVEVEP